MGHHKSIGGVTPFLKIQEGTWAGVYKAYDASLERYVLLKVLHDRFRHNEALVHQFEQEARLMAKVQHPNVVQILSYGEDQNQVYLTTEFVEGASLQQLLDIHGKLPLPVTLHIFGEMARGLSAAHDQEILHRDFKPANVLIANDGQVKLTDFGLATLKQADQQSEDQQPVFAGTPAYMAPEFITGSEPSVQTDLFALGASLFEMLTGKEAFRGIDSSTLFDSLLHYDPVPVLKADATIPGELIGLSTQLLHKSPEQRPGEAAAVVASITQLQKRVEGFDGPAAVQQFIEAPEDYQARAQLSFIAVPHQEQAQPTDTGLQTSGLKTTKQPIRSRHGLKWAGVAVVLLLAVAALLAWRNTDSPVPKQPTSITSPEPSDVRAPAGTDQDPPITQAPVTAVPVTAVPASQLAPEPEPSLPDSAIRRTSEIAATLPQEVAPPAFVAPAGADSLMQQNTNMAAPNGNLTVLCTPWCDVLLNGDNIGAAPPGITYTGPEGSYDLALVNPHYPTFSQRITVLPGQQDTVRLSFNDFVASVDLEILPWAEVFIDSVAYGTLPPNKTILLTPGTHLITLKNEELGEWQGELIVTAGEKRRQPYNLRELINN